MAKALSENLLRAKEVTSFLVYWLCAGNFLLYGFVRLSVHLSIHCFVRLSQLDLHKSIGAAVPRGFYWCISGLFLGLVGSTKDLVGVYRGLVGFYRGSSEGLPVIY